MNFIFIMSNEKSKVHINNVSKMICSKRIKLSEGMAIHIQNEAAKFNKKNPLRPRDLRRSVGRLKQYSV